MTVSSTANPFFLHVGPERVFSIFDPARSDTTARSAVLVCPPWGWEETASYRVRRTWARKLAAEGHPTLRFDLPGTGNSTGGPDAAERVEGWVETVAAASVWLRAEVGRDRLAVLGLGVGGLLALAAAGRGAAIDDFVLWGSPAGGRRFVREVGAFAKMQAWGVGRGDESPLPEGWLEAGGFVLSAETVAELKALTPQIDARPGLRAILLDRDGTATDPKLLPVLEDADFEVETASGSGWGRMTVHPETAVLPQEVAARVSRWLDEVPATAVSGDRIGDVPASSTRVEIPGSEPKLSEEAVALPGPRGDLFGILTEPLGEERAPVCAVFLSAGAIRHIGPSRIWVENARRWAARSVPSLRVDLDAIGESEGEETRSGGIAGFYSESYRAQVPALLDALQARGVADRFVLLGLCSGGYWSLQIGAADPRVCAAVMLNAGALVWEDELTEVRRVSLLTRGLRRRSSWRKLLRGEVDIDEKVKLALTLLPRRAMIVIRGRISRAGEGALRTRREQITALLDRTRARGLPIAMAFSANEYVPDELGRERLAGLADWPNVRLLTLAGEDHALGPIGAQESAREIIDEALEDVLARASVVAPTRR